jgi:hypothetical protein
MADSIGEALPFGDVNDTVMVEVYQHPEFDAAMKQIKDIPETDIFLSSNRTNIPTAPAWLFSLVTQLDTLCHNLGMIHSSLANHKSEAEIANIRTQYPLLRRAMEFQD